MATNACNPSRERRRIPGASWLMAKTKVLWKTLSQKKEGRCSTDLRCMYLHTHVPAHTQAHHTHSNDIKVTVSVNQKTPIPYLYSHQGSYSSVREMFVTVRLSKLFC